MTEHLRPSQFHAAEGAADWRIVGDGACAFFATASVAASARLIAAIAGLSGIEDHRPDIDLRPDGVTVRLLTRSDDWYGMTAADVELAGAISRVAREQGLTADPSAVQSVLVIPGAPDTAAIMPFWRALLGYEARPDSPDEDLVDPHGRGPAFWFETMREARSDGNGSIHIAVWVPEEAGEARVAAALAAGGRIVSDHGAPAWWLLADAAGNQADVATTKDRG